MTRPRILSGMRPTGPLHIGHLTGALDNWVRLMDTYECFFAIVDWHALTTDYADPRDVRENVLEVATDWLAAGLDPARSTLFVQSLVPEHAELHLLLSMIVPVPWLERVPSYREQQTQLAEKDLSRVPGTDGRKMSKSYGNAVFLKDPPEVVRQKIKPMVTDPARKRRTDPGNPEICPVFDLHKAFSPTESQEWAAQGCRTAGIGCLDCKGRLLDHLLQRLEGIHARRPEFAARPDTVWDILQAGSHRAREVARATMEQVRSAMKIAYPIR